MGDEVKAEVDVVKADLSDFMSNVKLDGAGDQQKDTNENCEKRKLIRTWLNHSMKVKITDGRTIIGIFLCTDKHSNLILGSCHEYFDISDTTKEPRTIGLSMIPGHHIISVEIDSPKA